MKNKIKKGIILSGGTGSRLYPLTLGMNKHLLPVYDKPLIYYPLTTLMLANIRDILIISTPRDLPLLKETLGTGEQFGITLSYQVQHQPNGLPEAFILGEKFSGDDAVALILGDNFFHGHGLPEKLWSAGKGLTGAHIFVCHVEDPERYGIVELEHGEKITSIEEKPLKPRSNLAITGLYYFDNTVAERAKTLRPSARNELEMVDLIKTYHQEDNVSLTKLGRGYVWFDAGTPKSLQDAARYVEVIQSRQGTTIASPEEVALYMQFIGREDFEKMLKNMPKSHYQRSLEKNLL